MKYLGLIITFTLIVVGTLYMYGRSDVEGGEATVKQGLDAIEQAEDLKEQLENR